MDGRPCSRATCRNYADRTLTYDYDDRMMVLGPLSASRASGGYDLCDVHAARISPPAGWTIVRHEDTPR